MITAVSHENILSVSGGSAILQNDPKVKLYDMIKKYLYLEFNSYGDMENISKSKNNFNY
jgi:hypothetical protein